MSYIAVIGMVIWSVAVAAVMYQIGFQNHIHEVWWSLGAATTLLIGLIGNVWIFFLIAKEKPWAWFKPQDKS